MMTQYKEKFYSRYSDGLWAERPGFDFQKEQNISLYSTASRPALGATQSPIQWVQGAISPGDKAVGT
jgi:hypothetical protein